MEKLLNLFRPNMENKMSPAKCSGKYLGYELYNLCLCGEEVSQYERQEIRFYEPKQCWIRLCAKCLLKKDDAPKYEPKATPEQMTETALSVVPEG